jgi:hypothetical protein
VVLNYAHAQQNGTSSYNNLKTIYDKKQEISAVQVSINKRDELNTLKTVQIVLSFDYDNSESIFTWFSLCRYLCVHQHYNVLFVAYF